MTTSAEPTLIPGAPAGASASWCCGNGAIYDRFAPADFDEPFVGRRYVWRRRADIDYVPPVEAAPAQAARACQVALL